VADFEAQGVADVLNALERRGGSDGRRVLRRFLGRWLTGGKSPDSDDIPSLRWRLGSAH